MTGPSDAGDGMVLDHIGIVVRSIAESLERWTSVFGYRQHTLVVTNTRQRVRVVFLAKPGSLSLKLLEPVDSTSTIYAVSRRGGGLHHLCFRCPSVDAEVTRLRAAGLRILEPPQPGEAFDNRQIAFVYAGDGVNLEVIDTDARSAVLSE
jgi:methylmalonyl-CoA/ethylmalonyl-CoA epimerase